MSYTMNTPTWGVWVSVSDKRQALDMTMETKQSTEIETASQAEGSQERQVTLALEGMTCASCAMRIEKGLKKVPGVEEASVNLATERATVVYNPQETDIDRLVQKVEAVGYHAFPLIMPAVQKHSSTTASAVSGGF